MNSPTNKPFSFEEQIELFADDKLNAITADITDVIADNFNPFEVAQMKGSVDKVIQQQMTRILSVLIKANQNWSKEQISFICNHYGDYCLTMGNLLKQVSELDY
jgi:hypothetical protein